MPLIIESLDALGTFVGKEIATTDWFEITQDRIDQFAETTEDRQWIHVDQERARRESPYGTTVAHGFLTLSLLSYFFQHAFQIQSDVGTVINYGLNRVRFSAPVPPGCMIRARFTLRSLEHVGKAREAIFLVVVEGQNPEGKSSGKPRCTAEWVIRFYPPATP